MVRRIVGRLLDLHKSKMTLTRRPRPKASPPRPNACGFSCGRRRAPRAAFARRIRFLAASGAARGGRLDKTAADHVAIHGAARCGHDSNIVLDLHGAGRARCLARMAFRAPGVGFLGGLDGGTATGGVCCDVPDPTMEFPRYVLIGFVGMFAFVGIGAASLRSTALRILVAVLIVHLSVPRVHDWLRHLHDAAWREATALADRRASGDQIAVFPPGSVKVVLYYLAPERRAAAVGLRNKCGTAPVLILSGRGVAQPEKVAAAEAYYPRVLAHLHLVEVRTR
jgi:hypothetical protein